MHVTLRTHIIIFADVPEPTEGSVGICTRLFCDFGASIGLKVTVTNINE